MNNNTRIIPATKVDHHFSFLSTLASRGAALISRGWMNEGDHKSHNVLQLLSLPLHSRGGQLPSLSVKADS